MNLNEKKLSQNLENSKDGKFEVIEVKLNNRKTKTIDKANKNQAIEIIADNKKNITNEISSFVSTKKLVDSR